jgi:uncharacterized protein YciW
LPRRVQALFAFVDALVESPRSLRSAHLEALRYVAFDTDGLVGLTRVAAAAIYESSFAAIAEPVTRPRKLSRTFERSPLR